jgi:hypothetical protein
MLPWQKTTLVVVASMAALFGTVPVAQAATQSHVAPLASCYAASCTGQDPHQTGCDQDATTIDSTSNAEGTVLLRWSNACQANWTTINNVPIWGANFWVENKAGQKQSYGWGFAGPASGWTNMVNGHNILARACDDDGCTGWH